MDDIRTRLATPADAATIVDFNAAMAEETEHVTLGRDRLAAGVSAVFADPHKGFYLVAERSGVIAGQMMITYEWSDWRNGNFWWIQSVYVHPAHRRQGVFRALFHHVQSLATTTAGVCGLRLYVETGNEAAQETYRRLGMKQAPYRMFEIDFVLAR